MDDALPLFLFTKLELQVTKSLQKQDIKSARRNVRSETVSLEASLEALVGSARRLHEHIKSINDPTQEPYAGEAVRLANLCVEVSKSQIEDIRENLISAYNLATRPKIDDEEIQFSHLLLDKLVNDVRDALLSAELAAESAGAPPPSHMNPSQSSVLIPTSEKDELRSIKGEIANIQSEMAAIRVSGTQVGFLNVQLEKMEVKLHLAEAILEVRKWIDGLNLERNISGIRIFARQIQGWLQDKSISILQIAEKPIDIIISASSSALRTVSNLISKYKTQKETDEIWSESEISAMLRDGKNIPEGASPYVRSISLSGFNSEPINLSELSKLRDLRYLSINYIKDPSNLHLLSSLTKLRTLSFMTSGPIRLDWINDLVNLEEVSIRGLSRSGSKIIFPQSIKLDKLSSLSINTCHAEKLPIFDTPSLLKLDVSMFDVDNYDNISTISGLRSIFFKNSRIVDFKFLMNLHELEIIDLRKAHFPNLSPLKSLVSLKTIFINRSAFSNQIRAQVGDRIELRGDHGGLIRATRW